MEHSVKNVLITGASGYIGQSLINKLLAHNFRLICFSTKSCPLYFQDNKKIVWIQNEYKNISLITSQIEELSYIIHLASQTSLYQAKEKFKEDFSNNTKIAFDLIEVARKFKAHFIFTSSATLVGANPILPVVKDTPNNIITFYDLQKMAIEEALKVASGYDFFSAVSLRLSNVYGYGVSSSANDRGILNRFVSLALKQEPITLWGDGIFLRDYIHVDDVVEGIIATLNYLKIDNVKYNCFYLATGESITIKDVLKEIDDLLIKMNRPKIQIHFSPFPEKIDAIEKRNFTANISDTQKKLNWKPSYNLKTGLSDLIKKCMDSI